MGELIGIAILAFMFFIGSKIVNAAKGGYKNVLEQFEEQQRRAAAMQGGRGGQAGQGHDARQGVPAYSSRQGVPAYSNQHGVPGYTGRQGVEDYAGPERGQTDPGRPEGFRYDLATGQPLPPAQATPIQARPAPQGMAGAAPIAAAATGAPTALQGTIVRKGGSSQRAASVSRKQARRARRRQRGAAVRYLGDLRPGDVEALRRAFVMTEVLGKPVALRKDGEHLPE